MAGFLMLGGYRWLRFKASTDEPKDSWDLGRKCSFRKTRCIVLGLGGKEVQPRMHTSTEVVEHFNAVRMHVLCSNGYDQSKEFKTAQS
jgi:hypothetical protein